MNYMPAAGMLIGILIGWIARIVFEDFREVWNGINERDAERAGNARQSCEQKN